MAGQTLQTLPEIGNLLLTARDGRPVYVRDVAKVAARRPTPTRRGSTDVVKTDDGLQPRARGLAGHRQARRHQRRRHCRAHHRAARAGCKGKSDPGRHRRSRSPATTARPPTRRPTSCCSISALPPSRSSSWWRRHRLARGARGGRRHSHHHPADAVCRPVMGYTLNRVSLFALIFSIGILVDDAIVVIENIARHWAMNDGRSRTQAAIDAVAEVGNPTIVATLTVVAALLPMLFVSGLMGPYMSPIPANASAAMIFSFFVAVIVTPWLMLKIGGKAPWRAAAMAQADGGRLGRIYVARRAADPAESQARAGSSCLRVGVADAGLAGAVLHQGRHGQAAALRQQVRAAGRRRPAGGLVGRGHRPRAAAGRRHRARDIPEVHSLQTYAGTAAPFNFNGLVRHYYLRTSPRARRRSGQPLAARASATARSHEIALDLREKLKGLDTARRHRREGGRAAAGTAGAGDPAGRNLWSRRRDPPRRGRARCARPSRACPSSSTSTTASARRRRPLRVAIDQDNLEYQQRRGARRLRHAAIALCAATTVGYSHRGGGRQPIPITLGLREVRQGHRRARPDDARSRQRAARRPRRGRTRRRGPRGAASCRPFRSSATMAAPPKW